MTSQLIHGTQLGAYYNGDSTALLRAGVLAESLRGKVNLLITSPPFPLNNKKSYGNLRGDQYLRWFEELAPLYAALLADNGSIVIELGNAWEAGRPVQSLLPLESLLAFVKNDKAGLRLCQQFACYNPARLPSPAQWVTVERIRTTDSYTHVWWMAKSDFPKADNRRVLRPYSKSMERLLKRQTYNHGKRPSEHVIGAESFLTDHGGSISQNFFEMTAMGGEEPRLPNAFRMANTQSSDYYLRTCRERGITPHPARMPEGLVAFFIEFLTDPGDMVLDPFAGSGTTAAVAERLERRWACIEIKPEYAAQVQIRLEDPAINRGRRIHPSGDPS